MAIVHRSKDFLHLLYLRVEDFLEWQAVTVDEDLHGIPEPLAGDAHLVQVRIVVEVAAQARFRSFSKLISRGFAREEKGAWLLASAMARVMGFDEALEIVQLPLAGIEQLCLGGRPLTESVAGKEAEARLLPRSVLSARRTQIQKEDIPIANRACRPPEAAKTFANLFELLARQSLAKDVHGRTRPPRGDAELVDVFGVAVGVVDCQGQVVGHNVEADMQYVPGGRGERHFGVKPFDPLAVSLFGHLFSAMAPVVTRLPIARSRNGRRPDIAVCVGQPLYCWPAFPSAARLR